MCLAIPGKIVEISHDNGVRTGRLQFGGILREVSLDFVPEVEAGDFVIVHAGFVIGRVDPEEAERTYNLLQHLGVMETVSPEDGIEKMEAASS